MPDEVEDGPAQLRRSAPLTRREWLRIVAAAGAPIPVAALVLSPLAAAGPAGPADVVFAAVVYGGLLGLASGFVVADRVQARQCPRCTTRNPRHSGTCRECAYDLATRPRFACSERHAVYVEPGLCDCGRRLAALSAARGLGPQVAATLKLGAWLLAFLVLMGLLLPALDRVG